MTECSLSRLVSQALVAFTIELDNEAERQLAHRTTRGRPGGNGGSGRAEGAGPWLMSFALAANVLPYLEAGPLRVDELRQQARTRLMLAGLVRWSYVAVDAAAGVPLRTTPQDDAVVRLRATGARAQEVWRVLPPLIETR